MRAGLLKSGFSQRYLLGWQSVQPLGAYSCFRALSPRKIYDGPLIRVRESAGNVEKDIYARGHWLDVATLLAHCNGNSGFITKFYDLSGHSKTLAQTTTTTQPRIVNAGVLDTVGTTKPAAVFDGADDRVTRADAYGLTGSPDITVGVVAKSTSGGSGILWGFGHNSTTAATRNDRWFGMWGADVSDSPDGCGATQGANSWKDFASWVGRSAASATIMQRALNAKISAATMINNGTTLSQLSLGTTAASNAMTMADLATVIGCNPSETGNFSAMALNAWLVYNAVLAGDDLTVLKAELAEHCS